MGENFTDLRVLSGDFTSVHASTTQKKQVMIFVGIVMVLLLAMAAYIYAIRNREVNDKDQAIMPPLITSTEVPSELNTPSTTESTSGREQSE